MANNPKKKNITIKNESLKYNWLQLKDIYQENFMNSFTELY